MEWSTRTSFFPLLSGYPAWVHCLHTPPSSSAPHLLAPLLRFLEIVQHAPPARLLPLHLFPDCGEEIVGRYILREGGGGEGGEEGGGDHNGAADGGEEGGQEGGGEDESKLFDFSDFPTLSTARLVLREVLLSDTNDVFSFRGDYMVTQHNCGAAYSLEQVQNLIQSQQRQYADKVAIRWGLTLRENVDEVTGGAAVGMVGFNYWDRTDRRASIGLELRQSLWGRGIMPEALGAVLSFGFKEMGLNRIEAAASEHNTQCISMLKKLGFVLEGVQREQFYEHGQYHDLVQMALLKREWQPCV